MHKIMTVLLLIISASLYAQPTLDEAEELAKRIKRGDPVLKKKCIVAKNKFDKVKSDCASAVDFEQCMKLKAPAMPFYCDAVLLSSGMSELSRGLEKLNELEPLGTIKDKNGRSYPQDLVFERGGKVYINNVLAQDEEGFLRPNIAGLPPIEVARSIAIRKGFRDPLELLPQRPGKEVPILQPGSIPSGAKGDPRPER
jgi:hypothetical protein